MKQYFIVSAIIVSMLFGAGTVLAADNNCCLKKTCVCKEADCCKDGKCTCKGNCCADGVCKCAAQKCGKKCNCKSK
ncbi:MAG: hypothetical protein WC330_03990 [Candidatus Omnitrophota bacterium]